MPGIVQSFLYGLGAADERKRQQEEAAFREQERAYLEQERAYQRSRRGVVDQREDRTWEQQQEDRAETLPYQRRVRDLDLSGREFENERRPVQARQQDESHEAQMRRGALSDLLAQRQDARAGAADSRSQREFEARLPQINLQTEAARLQLDGAQIEAERQRAAQEFMRYAQPIYQLAATGRGKDAVAAINQLYAQINDGSDDANIRARDDGSFYVEGPDGKPVKELGGADGLFEFVQFYLSTPEVFADAYVRNRAQAVAQAAEAAKESGRNYRAGLGVLGRMLTPSPMALPNSPKPDTSPEGLRAMQQAASGFANPQAAPATAQVAPAKRIVRTGTLPDGTRVVQYEDGTTELAQ